MKDYLLLFRGGLNFKTASPDQLQNSMIKWQKWLGELQKENKLGVGQRLTAEGKLLTGAKKGVTDGPYAEGKEIIGGFQFIKASSFDDAVSIARGCPIFDFGGNVEIREPMVS